MFWLVWANRGQPAKSEQRLEDVGRAGAEPLFSAFLREFEEFRRGSTISGFAFVDVASLGPSTYLGWVRQAGLHDWPS